MKKKNLLLIIILLMSIGPFIHASTLKQQNYVPDEETAIKIAEAIWLPIYGKGIYENKPFVARLKNSDVWIVEGTLNKGFFGGTPYIEIQKSDCKILKVTHGK
jgi:NTF2 fold immunity protein